MSKFLTNKVVSLKELPVEYCDGVKTKLLYLTNYQSAKICFFAVGSDHIYKETTGYVINAVLDDKTRIELQTGEIELNSDSISVIDFVADKLGHDEAKRIEVILSPIENSELIGTVFAVLGDARYEIENPEDEIVTQLNPEEE